MEKMPIQIWAPAMDISPYDATSNVSLEMAQKTWAGELRIWLSPEVDRKISWEEEPGVFESLIPAYKANVIDIFHLDRSRRLYPRLSDTDKWYRKGIPGDLYLRWLQAPTRLVENPPTVVLDFPEYVQGKIVKRPRPFLTSPGTIVSGVVEDAEHGLATILGPFRPKDRPPVSMMVDSEQLFGKAQWEFNENDQLTGFHRSEKLGRFKGRSMRIEWKEPFSLMYELGTSLDTMYIRSFILELIGKLNENNYSQSSAALQRLHDKYVRLGEAPISLVEYLPWVNTIPNATDRKYHLLNIKEDHNIPVKTFKELGSSPEFIEHLQMPIKVKCINTWTGFFIYQLVEDVLALKRISSCKHCGRLIRGGHRDRRFCTKEENANCFRARNTIVQRKRRHPPQAANPGGHKEK